MKKLILLSLIVLGTVSFSRDYTFNERRDIVKPIEENVERMSRFTPDEWMNLDMETTENVVKYEYFHWELDRMDKGENTNR